MLTILRRVKELDHRIRFGEAIRTIDVLSPGLMGKRVGLIGMGDTAYQTAQLLIAFNCKILTFSPSSPPSRWNSGQSESRYPIEIPHERFETLEELLDKVDILSIHCPLNEKTRNLIGKEEIGRMREHAIIINTARGGIIDERALAMALKQGKLGGAGLDVFEVEPAHGETLGELRDLLNVVCTPHV